MDAPRSETGPQTAPDGLIGRVIGVLFSPAETFARVAARPRWFGMLLLVVVVTGGAGAWLINTEVGRQAMVDEIDRRMESFGRSLTDEQYEQIRTRFEEAPAWRLILQTVGTQLVWLSLAALAVAGIVFAVFTAGLGSEASFRQVFALVMHSGAVVAVQALFVTPLSYARESMTSATNLAVFLPMLEEGSFLARLLGSIDLFLIWWAIVLAIGMSVLYRRRLKPVALAFLGVYGVIALLIATVLGLVSGRS